MYLSSRIIIIAKMVVKTWSGLSKNWQELFSYCSSFSSSLVSPPFCGIIYFCVSIRILDFRLRKHISTNITPSLLIPFSFYICTSLSLSLCQLSIPLSLFFFLSLSIYPSLSLSFFLCLSIPLCITLFLISLSLSFCICLFVCVSLSLSFYSFLPLHSHFLYSSYSL